MNQMRRVQRARTEGTPSVCRGPNAGVLTNIGGQVDGLICPDHRQAGDPWCGWPIAFVSERVLACMHGAHLTNFEDSGVLNSPPTTPPTDHHPAKPITMHHHHHYNHRASSPCTTTTTLVPPPPPVHHPTPTLHPPRLYSGARTCEALLAAALASSGGPSANAILKRL